MVYRKIRSSFKPFLSVGKVPAAVTAAILLAAVSAVWFAAFIAMPAGNGRVAKILEFPQGYTLKKVAHDLEASHVITSSSMFIIYSKLKSADSRIKAGAYLFNDGMTPPEILRKMIAGDVYAQKFAVPEGYSTFQIAQLLEQRKLFRKDSFLKDCTNPQLLARLGIDGPSVEGYLHPSTYDITPRMSESDLITKMVTQFRKTVGTELTEKAKALRMTPRQILTLASMIEKEAVVPDERPVIASVFFNRLRKGMPLQSDPTAVYRLRAFSGKVTKRDLRHHSAYNTYIINGLPPGPIGNPGRSSIEAALNPTQTDFLYFVAKRDGTHHFSTNLEEHNLAVRRYLRSRSPSTLQP